MWNEIHNKKDLDSFMKKVDDFHDSCIKEMKYLSGAYVKENLSMFPENNKRILKMIIQRQFEDIPVIEMEFSGLKFIKMFPIEENYTCEILDATFILKNGLFYWCDEGGLTEKDFDNYQRTLICAERVCWRTADEYIGEEDVYIYR